MLSAISCGIGRGHPFYLHGVLHALRAAGHDDWIRRVETASDLSHGAALAAWKALRRAYGLAGRFEAFRVASERLRSQTASRLRRPLLELLARDLPRTVPGTGILLVDHPLLVEALRGVERVWYVHGELASPSESVARGAERVLVPTDEAARAFLEAGYPACAVDTTGLCIDPLLVPLADRAVAARRDRLRSERPLTIAFFGSGAEPVPHVEMLSSVALAAARGGHHALTFVRAGGRFERSLRRRLAREPTPRVQISRFVTYDELDQETARCFASLDLFVAAPHERSSWALGLGLPIFLLEPDIGPFAPQNRALLLRAGVARQLSLEGAAVFAEEVNALRRSGALVRMLEAGLGPPIDGFRRAAETISRELTPGPAGRRPRASG